MGMGGFPAEGTKKCQAPINLAQPFPAPELRAEILWTPRFFFFFWKKKETDREGPLDIPCRDSHANNSSARLC